VPKAIVLISSLPLFNIQKEMLHFLQRHYFGEKKSYIVEIPLDLMSEYELLLKKEGHEIAESEWLNLYSEYQEVYWFG